MARYLGAKKTTTEFNVLVDRAGGTNQAKIKKTAETGPERKSTSRKGQPPITGLYMGRIIQDPYHKLSKKDRAEVADIVSKMSIT